MLRCQISRLVKPWDQLISQISPQSEVKIWRRLSLSRNVEKRKTVCTLIQFWAKNLKIASRVTEIRHYALAQCCRLNKMVGYLAWRRIR